MTIKKTSAIITPKLGGNTLSEKDSLIKQINRLIIGKVIEITIIIALVGLSIPAWSTFAAKIGDVDVIKIEDCKLNYKEKQENETDFLTIENNFAINKSYRVYLETDKNVDFNTLIVINNKEYTLNDFYYNNTENTTRFTLVDKNIVASIDAYNIKINNINETLEYRYIFEETNNF